MDREHIAYCGLDCERCKARFGEIRGAIENLNAKFEEVNLEQMSKAIPFMRSKYRGYRKLTGFFSEECPGCRNGGGNPFCGIRKCASKRGFFTCAECDEFCGKFSKLFKIHTDNEIQTNIARIRADGIDSLVRFDSE